MKYNILINQKAVYDAGLIGQVDLTELALFDFIYNLFSSDFDGKITFDRNGISYVEISVNLINAQMPLISMSKRSFIRKMNKLIQIGLIERYEGNQKENRSAFCRGKKWDMFQFSQPTPNLAHPTQDLAHPSAKFGTRPTPNLARNNNIEDNNIIYNREKEKEKNCYSELSLDQCRSVLTSNEVWKETIVMNLRSGGLPDFTMDNLNSNLDFFFKKLANEGVTEKSPKDAMSHFSRWLNLELKNDAKNKSATKAEANRYAATKFIEYCNSDDDSWTPGPDKPF